MNNFLKDCTDIQIGFDENTQPVSREDVGKSGLVFWPELQPLLDADVVDPSPYTLAGTAAGFDSTDTLGNIYVGANAGMELMTYSLGAWTIDNPEIQMANPNMPEGWIGLSQVSPVGIDVTCGDPDCELCSVQ